MVVTINTPKLKARIIERGYTQKTLAPRVEMSYWSLNSQINNRVPMTTQTAGKLITELGLSDPADIMTIFFVGSVPETQRQKGAN